MKFWFAMLLPAVLIAQDPQGFAMWKSSEITQKGKAGKADPTGMAGGGIGSLSGNSAIIVRRDQTGEAEVHEKFADIMVVTEGEATLKIGGSIADTRTSSPGEIRGKSLTGAMDKKIGPGDIVHLPAGLPHWVVVAEGKPVTYFLLKLEKK